MSGRSAIGGHGVRIQTLAVLPYIERQLLKRNNAATSIERGFRAHLARDMVKRYRRRQKKL